MAEYSQKWHNGTSRGRSIKTSDRTAAITQHMNNLSPQYAISTGQNGKLVYKSRQMTIPFPSRLDNHYYEEEERIYEPKFIEAYGASHINYTIPRKEKDRGSFTLPCFINNVWFNNALVDLGASVSVMPLLTYLNLGLGELAHTRLTVELADRIMKYPKGIARNVLVGIGKFTFPIDFIILDMIEDIKVPLILRRPILSTARYPLRPFLEINELNDLNEPIELRRNQEIWDAYRDEGIVHDIIAKPFLRELELKSIRFEGIITLYKSDDEATYISHEDIMKNYYSEDQYA
ncbi:retrovirus-related pol polyprotein from transposon TNT 1-94 [Tanacetum coccineum]